MSEPSWPDYVARCLTLAMLLEVSAYPKPGNVHRTADFPDTRYEHFLASAAAMYPVLREGAEKGSQLGAELREVLVGRLVRACVEQMLTWQSGGNTHLGAILLLVPLSVAAGALCSPPVTIGRLKSLLRKVLRSTTPLDAIEVYEAIAAANPGGLGSAPTLDVKDEESRREIVERGVTLLEVFEIASSYDSIAREWVTGYEVTFELGFPRLLTELEAGADLNSAIVDTFLYILSRIPDTLIARKHGRRAAEEVSEMASRAMSAGGLLTEEGQRAIAELDSYLRSRRMNPGTTADLVCSSLAVLLLTGYRP